MKWTQTNPNRNQYWEAEYDFWITSRQFRNLVTDQTRERWVLFNGFHELGVYDTLEEAQNAAEPCHGLHEDKESAPVCYWCGGIHLGEICKNAPYYVEGQEPQCPHCHGLALKSVDGGYVCNDCKEYIVADDASTQENSDGA